MLGELTISLEVSYTLQHIAKISDNNKKIQTDHGKHMMKILNIKKGSNPEQNECFIISEHYFPASQQNK